MKAIRNTKYYECTKWNTKVRNTKVGPWESYLRSALGMDIIS